jgi:multisubunit Na+/H+ antiporter MnhF subunit
VTLIDLSLALIVVAMVLGVVRVLLGPSGADRGGATDLVFFGFVGLVALLGVRLSTTLLVDIVLVATLVGLLAAISLARLTAGGKR